MTTKELIRQEIERELSAHDKVDHLDAFEVGKAWNRGHRKALERLLSFLDTLPDEPVSDDLEEAADDHIRKVVDAAGHPGWDWETQDIADAFKAGAEWQKQKDDRWGGGRKSVYVFRPRTQSDGNGRC